MPQPDPSKKINGLKTYVDPSSQRLDTRKQPWKDKIVVKLPDDQMMCANGEVRLQKERDLHVQMGG